MKHERVQSAYNQTVTKAISDVGRSRMCRALLPEYKAYIRALSSAINLSLRDKQTSLDLSRTLCPDLDWLVHREDFV